MSLLQQVQRVRPRHGFGAVAGAQLPVGIGDVTLDRGQADEELLGDLLIPHSRRDETQDLDLPGVSGSTSAAGTA